MKNKFIILFLLCLINYSHSQTQFDELIIINENNYDTILVRVIPSGYIFAGDSTYRPYSKYYSSNYRYSIFAGQKKLFYRSGDPSTKRFGLNHDVLGINNADSVFGFGKYRIEIYKADYDSGGFST